MSEINQIKEVMKKSAFTAKTVFDYEKMIFKKPYLLDTVMEEKKEELEFIYDMEDRKSMTQLGDEDMLTIYAVLMNVQKLQDGLQEYAFSLEPENLYYDMDRKVYAKVRDIYPAGRSFEEKEFLADYQALVGAALQNRYTYQDYKRGGLELLNKQSLLGKVRKAETPERIRAIMFQEYRQLEAVRKERQQMLSKGKYRRMVAAIILLSVLSVGTLGYMGYSLLLERPYTKAMIAADNAYIEMDYVGCIDAMKEIEVADMQHYQKFILANSYVHSENLKQNQKEKIIANMSTKDAPIRLEYWIYLGRGDADQAIDIAMQQSDDEMRLYAYMKQKALIESDTTLKGSEKTAKLEEIDSKIEPLMGKYDTEEVDSENGKYKEE